MRLLIESNLIQDGVIALSYMGTRWGKYGWCAWQYDDYFGKTEWINLPKFVTEPEYAGATGILIYPAGGVFMSVAPWPNINNPNNVPGVIFNGVTVNPATGEGFPSFFNFEQTGVPTE